MNSNLVPAFLMTNFAKDISSSYTDLQAYRSGAIDANGNLLKPESSIDPYEYFVIKIKRIFDELPPGITKARLSSYLPALMAFSEEVESHGISKEQFNFFVEGYVALQSDCDVSYLALLEDMGSANLGGPASSPTQNTGGVSGIDLPMRGGVQKRKSVLGFEDSCHVFDVCPDDYKTISSAKSWRDVPENETRKYLQRYQRRNSKGNFGIRNTENGDLHWVAFGPKSIIEQFNLDNLKILNEKQDLTEPIKKLMEPVLNPPEEDKEIKGAKIERLGKLVHGTRALATGLSTDSPSLLRDIERQLIDLSGKSISNNEKDAIDVDPNTKKIIDLDIKGHNTTTGTRIDVGEYGEHEGLEDVLEPLQATLRDVDAPPEVLGAAKKKARQELDKLSASRHRQLKDIVLGSIKNNIPLSIFPGSDGKKYRFPFMPTLTSAGLLKGYVENVPDESVKYHLRPSGNRPEVGVRVPDISSQKAQGVFTTVAKNLKTGEMVNAQIDQESLENVLKNISPTLHGALKRVLAPYTR